MAQTKTRGRVPPPRRGVRYWDVERGMHMIVPSSGGKAVPYQSAEGERLRAREGGGQSSARRALRQAGIAGDRAASAAARRATGEARRVGREAPGAVGLEGGFGGLLIYGAASLLGLIVLDVALSGRGPAGVERLLGAISGGVRKLVDPSDPLIAKGAEITETAPAGPGGGASPGSSRAGAETRPGMMLAAIRYAQGLGLDVRENPFVDPVERVHTTDSWHYEVFPDLYDGKELGQAIDVQGPPAKLRQFFGWVARHWPNATELIYDDRGAIFDGVRKPPGDYDHPHHVHFVP